MSGGRCFVGGSFNQPFEGILLLAWLLINSWKKLVFWWNIYKRLIRGNGISFKKNKNGWIYQMVLSLSLGKILIYFDFLIFCCSLENNKSSGIRTLIDWFYHFFFDFETHWYFLFHNLFDYLFSVIDLVFL